MKKANIFLELIEKAVLIIDSILLLAIVLIVVVQVICRYMNIAMTGTEELARYAYVCFAFLAWPIAALRGTDVSVTFLFDLLPGWLRDRLLGLFHLSMAAFAAIATYSMTLNTKNAVGIVASSNRWLHMSWLYGVVTVGLAATIVFNLIRAFWLFSGNVKYLTQTEKDLQELEAAVSQFEASENKEGEL